MGQRDVIKYLCDCRVKDDDDYKSVAEIAKATNDAIRSVTRSCKKLFPSYLERRLEQPKFEGISTGFTWTQKFRLRKHHVDNIRKFLDI